MSNRVINIVIGVLFLMAGLVTLLDGIFNMRVSNLCIGIGFTVVSLLYFMRKEDNKQKM